MDQHWKPGKTSTKNSAVSDGLDDVLGDLLGDDDDDSSLGLSKNKAAEQTDLGADLFGKSDSGHSPAKSAMASRSRPNTAPEKKKSVTFSPPGSPPKTADAGSLAAYVKRDDIKEGVRQKIAEKKIDFGDFDEDDPLAGLLSDDESTGGPASRRKKQQKTPISAQAPPTVTQAPPTITHAPPTPTDQGFTPSAFTDRPPTRSGPQSTPDTGSSASAASPTPVRRREQQINFSDDDDPLASLSSDSPAKKKKTPAPESSRPAKSIMDDLLGKKATPEKPPVGGKREFVLDDKYRKKNGGGVGQRPSTGPSDDDFIFGDYRPSSAPADASPSMGRRARASPTPLGDSLGSERPSTSRGKATPSPEPTAASTTKKPASDWLGLGDDDTEDVPLFGGKSDAIKPPVAKQAVFENQPVAKHPAAKHPVPRVTKDELTGSLERPKKKPEVTKRRFSVDDWLAADLATVGTPTKADTPTKSTEIEKADVGKPTYDEVDTKSLTASREPSPVSRKDKLADLKSDLFSDSPPSTGDSRAQQRHKLSQQLFQDDADLFPSRPATAPSSFRGAATNSIELGMPTPQFLSTPAPQAQHVPRGEGHVSQVTHHVAPNVTSTSGMTLPAGLTGQQPQLESKILQLELEKSYLQSMLDMAKKQHSDEMDALRQTHTSKVTLMEESFDRREKRLREELTEVLKTSAARVELLEKERTELVKAHQAKLEERDKEKKTEMERLRDIHRSAMSDLQHEHEDALTRIRQAKDREMESVADVQSTTRSVSNVLSALEDQRRELGAIQHRVAEHSSTNLQQRDQALQDKDQQLSALQERLTKQQEENDRERLALQQLVGKMEAQLRDQTRQIEDEKWRVKQEKSKLESLQIAADSERTHLLEQTAREQAHMQQAKTDLLAEQKRVMGQLLEERRTVAEERSKFEVEMRIGREQIHNDSMRVKQLEAELEGKLRADGDERERLHNLSSDVQTERQRLTSLQLSLEQERTRLDQERRKLTDRERDVNERAEEVARVKEFVSKTGEEGLTALETAKKLEQAQQQRVNSIQNQLNTIKQREKQLNEQRTAMNQLKLDIESARKEALCYNCRQPHMGHQSAPGGYHGAPGGVHSPGGWGRQTPPGAPSPGKLSHTIERDHAARMWKVQADKDNDFLSEESVYLQALKHSPYHK